MLERMVDWMTAHPVIASALAVLVLGWLFVSLLRPGAQRRRIEWIAATSMYVVLLGLFVNLLRRAIADDSLAGMVAFGFLATMFTCGLLVSSFRTFRALAGRASTAKSSATH